MSKVLFIKANPKKDCDSNTFMLANVFVEEYKKKNPEDTIQTIDLYHEDIRPIEADMLDKIFSGQDSVAKRYAELFASADKYIFAAPMWNLSIPAIMKCFLDYVTYAGVTFKYTENGSAGLLSGQNKKAVHIVARGGKYTYSPMKEIENGDRYLRQLLAFMGIEDIETIALEQTNVLQGEELEKQRQEAYKNAVNIANQF